MSVTLATVIPVYRGAPYLPELVAQIERLRDRWRSEGAPVDLAECIFVDDGSVDDSAIVLRELADERPWVQVLTLSRNYGQHAATVAGICHSSSDWLVTMDEDLQHDPSTIEAMLRKAVEESADAVYARPSGEVHGGSWRDKASHGVKSLLARTSKLPAIRYFNSFRLLRGNIARAAASASSAQTYFDIAVSWFTNSYAYLAVEQTDQRVLSGKASGYSLRTLARHARHLIISSHVDIASKGIVLGLISTGVAVLAGLWVLWYRFFAVDVPEAAGWASLLTLVALLGGISIVLICICLEYINVLLLNQLGKPTFFAVRRESDAALREWFGTIK